MTSIKISKMSKKLSKKEVSVSPSQEYFNMDSDIYKAYKSFDDKFHEFAKYLMTNLSMKIGTDIITIEEVEVYYNSFDHKDEYTHKSKDQLTNTKWYFHQYHNGTYKSGTYKGMDITFGNNKDIYGGVLIRSIENTTTGEFITGPCNTVNYILKKLNCKEVDDLVTKMDSLDIFNNKNPFYVEVKTGQIASVDIFTGPRVGLSWKYPSFLTKEYRYLKQPTKIPKNRASIIGSLHNKNNEPDTIVKLTGLTKSSVKKAIDEFTEGGKLLEKEVKELKHDKINKIFGYYCEQQKPRVQLVVEF